MMNLCLYKGINVKIIWTMDDTCVYLYYCTKIVYVS